MTSGPHFALVSTLQLLTQSSSRHFGANLQGRFDVVAREKAGHAIHDPLPPPVIILLQDVDGRTLREGQLVFLVGRVVVDGGHSLDEVLRHPVRYAGHATQVAGTADGAGVRRLS